MSAAAKRVFGAYVHVMKKDGTSEAFAPGDVVPSWAAKLVGDHVLAQPEAPEEPTEPAKPTDDGTPSEAGAELADLQAKLEAIGQPTDGTAEELRQRLTDHGE